MGSDFFYLEGLAIFKRSLHLLVVLSWGFVLFCLTCTHDFSGLLYSTHFHFDVNVHPDFQNLFITSDIDFGSPFWWVVKGGHFLGFAVFEGLLVSFTKKRGLSLFLTITFAVLTEVLQLYFYRDGRLYDMIIDSLGALLMAGGRTNGVVTNTPGNISNGRK